MFSRIFNELGFLLLSNTFYISQVIGNAQYFQNMVKKAPVCAKIKKLGAKT
jgi:hypothetical protein